jgi:hypothetical protein
MIMKTFWVFASAAVTVLGFLTSQAKAQGPNPQALRPDLKPIVGNNEDRKDRQYHVPLSHLIPHAASSSTPGFGTPVKPYMKPLPTMVPGESFTPPLRFNVPTSFPKVPAAGLAVHEASCCFRSVAGHGAPVGIGGGLAAFFAALFGRKKKPD